MHDNPTTRPGHDLRYALDGGKLQQLGWRLPLTFYDSLSKTVRWMVSNPEWLDIGSYKGAVSASSANASSTLVGKSVRAQMVGGGAPATTATGSDFNYQ